LLHVKVKQIDSISSDVLHAVGISTFLLVAS